MAEKRRRPGRPRKEDEAQKTLIVDGRKFSLRPKCFPRDFVQKCANRYEAARRPQAPPGAKEERLSLVARAAQASGDPLFSTDPIVALAAYGLADAPRPNKAVEALKGKTFGSEALWLADYARAYSRSVGISIHLAIADAIATCAERGTFVLTNGQPAVFESAMSAVYRALKSAPSPSGDTGKMLRVKPAREGAVVRVIESGMRPLAADGERVPDNRYWRRRLLNGDVVEVPYSARTHQKQFE